ncbi:SAVED domain-containing protein [Rhodobacter capsulatus]|uniref:SAVED domain-containing protein n=1 Tax=Rhodobacter capsulatus TaxID=1061 RepID=A0A4U1JLH4_RHOCA|nr:SAVED domain-containing protein [Rhodobacter capsulatus]TKD13769.1 SAVED domain-containing protein [Rhodobacter capsulatus]
MSFWRKHGDRFFDGLITFIFRTPSWPSRLLRAGVTLIVAGLSVGGLAGDLSWIDADRVLRLTVQADGGGSSVYWSQITVFLGILLATVGVILGVIDHIADRRQLRKQSVVVLEHRGLHQTVDTPLASAVPKRLKGRIDVLPVDHRQSTSTSQISSPEDALSQIAGLRQQLRQKRDAAGPGNVRLVYGGMAPVPLTFLTGMMVGNEAGLTVMDWDRFAEKWREPDGADDGDRFVVSGMDGLKNGIPEVALAVAVSYPSDADGIRATLGEMPLIRLALPNLSTTAHWSADKQSSMAKDFTDILGDLMAKGVKRVHLFIAAPNSVVFTLGRHLDDRLHPEVLVYQYERSASPPFPWAVKMPTHGQSAAQIVRSGAIPIPPATT